MFFSGIGLITLSVATGYSLQYESQTSIGINKIIFNSSTSEFWVQITVLILGALFSIAGGYLWTRSTLEESSNEKKKRMVVIEQRGLRDTTDDALSDFVLKEFKGQIKEITVDIREGIIDGKVIAPEAALEKVKNITFSLQESCKNISSENLSIIHGGLLPVPYTFLTGLLLTYTYKLVNQIGSSEIKRPVLGFIYLARIKIRLGASYCTPYCPL